MLFGTKKYSLQEVAPMEVDTHSHLIIGVDDGVRNEQKYREAIASLELLGVKRAFTTPHIKAELENTADSLKGHAKNYGENRIEIRLAAEYMLDESFLGHISNLLSYDGKHVLVELPRIAAVVGSSELIGKLQIEGFTPVLAHPERYLHHSQGELMEMKERGVKMQLCVPSLWGGYGDTISKRAHKFLQSGLYSFVGSDAHGTLGSGLLKKVINSKEGDLYEELVNNNASLWV